MGKSAGGFLWRYLATYEDGDDPDAPLFLGHGSLDMVKYYARIAGVDIEHARCKSSLADNWRLLRSRLCVVQL